jgi:hypothetical protein
VEKIVFSALAGAAMAVLSAVPAGSATCSGTLTNACRVFDAEGDVATEASAAAADLRAGNDLTISEVFDALTFASPAAFVTSGEFVNNSTKTSVPGTVSVTVGGSGDFASLLLKFNSGPAISILAPGVYIFSVLTGINTFEISGVAHPKEPAGSVDYAVTLSAVPLPPAALLFGTALAGVGLLSRRRRAA